MIEQSATTVPLKTRFAANMIDDWIVAIGLLLIVAILWLPFGIAVPFWADSWQCTSSLIRAGMLQPENARPLVAIPFVIGQSLSPNLFVGENLLLAGLLFAKSWLLYLILKRLLKHRAIAFGAASLLLIYPADEAIFNLGTINIHFDVASYLLAVYLLLWLWQERRWVLLPFIGLALGLTTGIYEAAYPLIIFTPLLLLWQEKRFSRRLVTVSLLWYVVPLAVTARLVLITSRNQTAVSYQSGLFRGIVPQEVFSTFWNVYHIHFADGWQRYPSVTYPQPTLAAMVIAAVICWWLSRHSTPISLKTLGLVIAGGLVVIGLGYVVYFPTALRDAVDRTFFFSSVGAAIVTAALLWAVAQFLQGKRLIYAGMIAFFVGLGTIQLLNQHMIADEQGRAELPVLKAIITQVPLIQSNTLVLVIDESDDHQLGGIFVSISFYLQYALQLISQNPGSRRRSAIRMIRVDGAACRNNVFSKRIASLLSQMTPYIANRLTTGLWLFAITQTER